MAQLNKVRLPNGDVVVPGDWIASEPLYSTVEIGPQPVPVLRAFSYGIGGEVPGSPSVRSATVADTNLQGEGGRLPENEELIAYTLCIEMFQIGPSTGDDSLPVADNPDVSLLDMLRLQRDLITITRIANVKEYTHAPVSWFPASTGVNQWNSGARSIASGGTEGYVVGNNGGTTVSDARKFASPLHVLGGQSLSVDIVAGPGVVEGLSLEETSRIRMRLYFDGFRKRPVA